MLYRSLCRTLSIFLFGLSLPLLLPLIVALYCEHIAPQHYPQPHVALSFLSTIAVTLGLGALFRLIGKKGAQGLYRREAFLLVVIVYFLLSAVSALPFSFSGALPKFSDAFFEMVSGYTTTGSTVIESKQYDDQGKETPIERTFVVGSSKTYHYLGTVTPVKDSSGRIVAKGLEALSPALLIWRSMTQFIGGGGIVILFLALLPILGVGGKVLYQSEATGPSKETMAPRITETASQLWKIYLGLTLLEVFLLKITNLHMPLLDAICLSFSTLSTGGFAPKNASVGAYHSGPTELIVALFMILGSINFSIYFYIMRGRWYRIKDPELWIFLCVIFFCCIFAAIYVRSFRYGAFQMISTITTTGFVTTRVDYWPFPVQALMLLVMFVGGMASSTAGGIKIVRFQIFYRAVVTKIESFFRPDSVRTLRIAAGKFIDEKIVSTALCFFVVIIAFTALGTFLLIIDGNDPETALTTIASMINNIGFGLRMASPAYSFAFLSTFSKLLCCVWMIAGRLEFFALLVILMPSFWRRP